MQNTISRRRPLGFMAIIILLIIQGILMLLFSLSLLVVLLAPGRPVIVHGASIYAGPAAGVALVVGLASPIIAWGLWTMKHWGFQRTVLLEIFSLGVGVLELTEPGLNLWTPITLMIIAALILICLYVFSLIGLTSTGTRR
jgi:hypothetical protein